MNPDTEQGFDVQEALRRWKQEHSQDLQGPSLRDALSFIRKYGLRIGVPMATLLLLGSQHLQNAEAADISMPTKGSEGKSHVTLSREELNSITALNRGELRVTSGGPGEGKGKVVDRLQGGDGEPPLPVGDIYSATAAEGARLRALPNADASTPYTTYPANTEIFIRELPAGQNTANGETWVAVIDRNNPTQVLGYIATSRIVRGGMVPSILPSAVPIEAPTSVAPVDSNITTGGGGPVVTEIPTMDLTEVPQNLAYPQITGFDGVIITPGLNDFYAPIQAEINRHNVAFNIPAENVRAQLREMNSGLNEDSVAYSAVLTGMFIIPGNTSQYIPNDNLILTFYTESPNGTGAFIMSRVDGGTKYPPFIRVNGSTLTFSTMDAFKDVMNARIGQITTADFTPPIINQGDPASEAVTQARRDTLSELDLALLGEAPFSPTPISEMIPAEFSVHGTGASQGVILKSLSY